MPFGTGLNNRGAPPPSGKLPREIGQSYKIEAAPLSSAL
jgi:hypothetical protein